MANNAFSYSVETNIPSSYAEKLIDFIYQKYIQPEERRFTKVSKKILDGDPSLTFTLLDSTGKQDLDVEIRGIKPIKLKITPLDETITEEQINEVKQDVVIAVELFEENLRKSTLFFAWREGEEIVPEQVHGKEKKSINRLFLETQILLFMFFIVVSIFLFQLIGGLTPIVLLAIQLIFVVCSNKIIARAADWRITENNPTIHLLEYHLPLEEHDTFRQKFSKDRLLELKKEVYEQTISKKGEIDCNTAHQIFLKSGFECKPENLASKKVNVYQLVKQTADKFGFPMPEVVVSNTIIPNAAASGPSPSRGVVLITTGLLVQLDDNEILSVLGHEFGHLKGRDPLFLYGLTAVQYLFLFYVFYNFLSFSFLLFFLYFWAVMTVIYFIAKFFEARADLVSAMVIGQPKVLAEALEKIGFRRLLHERMPSYRVQEWISLEPHPPIYFRVNRLEKVISPVKINHPLFQSAKDVTLGFLASLRACELDTLKC
jgi:heat shock protein HtpX